MDKVKKLLFFRVPMSICNFRCHYCYIAQRPVHFQGIQPEMKYSPEQVGYALRKERVGGSAFINICADGETLLTNNLHEYVREMLKQGHYVEVVTNLTITNALDKFLEFPKDLLNHLEFKCSFHYLELKKRNLLEVFAQNVKKVWHAGASASIEVTPSDELIPHIEELKEFSRQHFGALPHITIARDDRTKEIGYLTQLPIAEYDRVWGQMNSGFWQYKKTVFGKKQRDFCYAGAWSLYIDLTTGDCNPCYFGKSLGNIFENPEDKLPSRPVGRCKIAHCYNAHAFLTLGNIPGSTEVGFGDIRDRIKEDGSHWLQPELHSFFNTKLRDSNVQLGKNQKNLILFKRDIVEPAVNLLVRGSRKIGRKLGK